MSQISFAPLRGPIVVRGKLVGPGQSVEVKLIVDTGATTSMIHLPVLLKLGIDPARDGRPVLITTASAQEPATRVVLTLVSALGQSRVGFPVVAHTLPPNAIVDGLLGLDFFQGHVLTLDFQVGTITLT